MKKKSRLLGCLLGAVLGMTAVLPASAAAKETAEEYVYVMTKSEHYNGYGIMTGLKTYEYDEKGNLTKDMAHTDNGGIGSWYSYEYDEKGNLTKYMYGYGDNVQGWKLCEYDENGNQMKQTYYHGDGTVSDWTLYEYDEKGNLTKAATYMADGGGEPSYWSLFEYDENGKRIIAKNYAVPYMSSVAVLNVWTLYEYGENGNLIKETNYSSKGSVLCLCEYNENGNPMKETYYDGNGTLYKWYAYEYDSNGNQTKYTSYNDDGTVEEWKSYEYDENGNQIKSTYYNGDDTIKSYAIYEYTLIKIDVPEADTPEGNHFATYEGYGFYIDEDGNITCYDSTGAEVINEFKCDGTYTYFFQADGTAMKDRLSYHPDGKHVIYFDENGHEVFSDFANVKKTIAGDAVDDFCFFDVYGYLYVDVVTYDKTGTVLYYANPYGVMERGKWFQFSNTVMYPGQNGLQPWEGAAGGYGYANADGTLMTNQWTYDWEGRQCYMQGNGVALYE